MHDGILYDMYSTEMKILKPLPWIVLLFDGNYSQTHATTYTRTFIFIRIYIKQKNSNKYSKTCQQKQSTLKFFCHQQRRWWWRRRCCRWQTTHKRKHLLLWKIIKSIRCVHDHHRRYHYDCHSIIAWKNARKWKKKQKTWP